MLLTCSQTTEWQNHQPSLPKEIHINVLPRDWVPWKMKTVAAFHSLAESCILGKCSTLKRFNCMLDYPKPERTDLPPRFLCVDFWITGSRWIFVSAGEKGSYLMVLFCNEDSRWLSLPGNKSNKLHVECCLYTGLWISAAHHCHIPGLVHSALHPHTCHEGPLHPRKCRFPGLAGHHQHSTLPGCW